MQRTHSKKSKRLERLLCSDLRPTEDLEAYAADLKKLVRDVADEELVDRKSRLLKAIANETRLKILRLLSIREMCVWIRENLGAEVPVHFNRFFPAYKMTHLPPTPVETLERARAIAVAEGMRFVYIGNGPGHTHNSTFCPECGKKIISRTHFHVHRVRLKNGRCRYCDYPVPGIWDL